MIILMDAKYYDKLISSNIDWNFMIYWLNFIHCGMLDVA
jgi:hypothetical protein